MANARRTPHTGGPVEVLLSDLSHIEPRGVQWLWPGRIPLGKVTLLVGDPGRGKSLITLDMASRISRGAPWPEACHTAEGGCATSCAPLGRTILLSAEDDTADTIRPRLDALGGDPARVCVLRAIRHEGDAEGYGEQPFALSRDLRALEAVIRQWDDVRLVVLDPVSAYLGGAESYNNADIRRLLAPVQTMAERAGVAVVAVTHLTKRAGAAVMYRAMGSLAFVSAARAVWAAVPDREEPGRLFFLPIKCNLAAGVSGLAYRIEPSPADPAQPIIAWEPEPVQIDAQDVLFAPLRRLGRLDRAAEWLEALLSPGPMLVTEAERRAGEAGFAPPTLRRAKTDLGIVSRREGTGWMWRLPEHGDAEQLADELVAIEGL